MSHRKTQHPSVFFPERMEYVEIVSPIQAAYNTIKCLAENGKVQLIDPNEEGSKSSKRYVDTLNRVEEASRSLEFLKTQLVINELIDESRPPRAADALAKLNQDQLQMVLSEIKATDAELREKLGIYDKLRDRYQSQIEQQNLLEFLIKTLSTSTENPNMARDDNDLLSPTRAENSESNFDHSLTCTGYVRSESQTRLQNMIYRVTRHNAVIYFGDSDKGYTPYVAIVSFSSSLNKVEQICSSFSERIYKFSSSSSEITREKRRVADEIQQSKAIIQQAYNNGLEFLKSVTEKYWPWRAYISREIEIWTAIDYGDYGKAQSAVFYYGWMPKRYVHMLEHLTRTATEESGSPVPVEYKTHDADEILASSHGTEDSSRTPPTYIENNEFTGTFQLLNDSYGIPDYNELNAGAFYCMYPFLFGIMFGDIGHSIFYILATICLFLYTSRCKKNGDSAGGMLETLSSAKWFLLFASLSALYCGLIYNECFGLPIFIFGKSYFNCENGGKCTKPDGPTSIYPVGIDPNWLFSSNELLFLNSFKMKLSIVMGMSQMIFGLILSGINIYVQRHYIHYFTHFIPQVLYLVPFFGYLVVIIIIKWTIKDGYESTSGVSPNLISVMIGMILNFGEVNKEETLYERSTQKYVQMIITIVFFISIPWLLFAQPIVDFVRNRKNPDYSALESFVMNLIHVIEFCLSALSHTASYLRLWALSLAHSELSNVLYEQLFLLGFSMDVAPGTIVTIITMLAFACMTIAILLGMESFSALLHAIRLMWVEFSSKFYHGQGIPFTPLSVVNGYQKGGFYA